jgi:small subunit ribosomal protein S6
LAAAREYELVLMLDPGRDAPARDALAAEARKQIEAGGTLKHENDWGLRKMAYEISRANEADYRWFRFEATTELLESLDHNLKIADGVLRFRIFRVDPDAPVMVPPTVAAPIPGREGREGRDRDSRDRSPDRAPQAAAVGDADDDSSE